MGGTLEGAAEGERIFIADHICDRADRELRVSQKLFCFCDAKFADILMYGNADLLFEKLAEIIFGKADLIADRIDVQSAAVILPDIFKRGVDDAFLHGRKRLCRCDAYGQLVKLAENIMDEQAGLHVGKQLVRIIQIVQVDKAVEQIAERVGGMDSRAIADRVIKLLGVASGDDNINKGPFPARPDKGQGRVTGGDDEAVRM